MSFQAQEHCLGFIAASPYSWFFNQAFINFRTGILELHGITCFGNLQPPLFFYLQFTKFFVICLYKMFSTFFFYHFPSPPSLSCPFLIFSISLLSCFIYKICPLVSFLIAPLGYLISIKYLCRYSRNTEENHLSFILCEVSLSLVAILDILFICNFIYSVILCNPALFQHSIVIFDLSP